MYQGVPLPIAEKGGQIGSKHRFPLAGRIAHPKGGNERRVILHGHIHLHGIKLQTICAETQNVTIDRHPIEGRRADIHHSRFHTKAICVIQIIGYGILASCRQRHVHIGQLMFHLTYISPPFQPLLCLKTLQKKVCLIYQ